MMNGATDFMGETLNNILSMQKIEEGKMELTFAPFNISDSIVKIISAMSGATMAKRLQVEKHIAAEVPQRLVGDVFRVEHVISNLLSNAIKFSPTNGSIRVNVSAANTVVSEAPFTNVTVSISDEGPGISAENQEKLFDGYFQVRPDQLQQGKGSGLGLALCKQIVTLHSGTIGVTSAEGQGSTFHFCIPFGVPNNMVDTSEEKEMMRVFTPSLVAVEATFTQHCCTESHELVLSPCAKISPSVLVVDGKSNQPPQNCYILK